MVELTGESVGMRVNTEHPVLKDLRVRQAINMSIDRKSMIDALYGDVAEPLNGMMVRKTLGRLEPEPEGVPVRPGEGEAADPGGRSDRPEHRDRSAGTASSRA